VSVGAQSNKQDIDQTLTDLAVAFRNLCQRSVNLSTEVNGQGDGLTVLVSLGYSDTPNPGNPGGQSDAAWALQALAYLNTVAGVYYGTVQQGGQNGTGAATFDFHNALSLLWAGNT
jgi:hypothetical protein